MATTDFHTAPRRAMPKGTGSRSAILLSLLSVLLQTGLVAAETGGSEETLAACQDGADNDGDGQTDCSDSDCQYFTVCANRPPTPPTPPTPPSPPPAQPTQPVGSPETRASEPENTLAACQDGRDNDGDGQRDCADSDCQYFVVCAQSGQPAPQPTQPAQPQPTAENTAALCRDAVDNDGDGRIDCFDQDCAALPACQPQGPAPQPVPQPAQPQPPQPPPPPPPPAEVEVSVRSSTEEARLSIDDESVGDLPWEGELEVGSHTLRIGREGYRTHVRTIDVVPSTQPIEVEVDLIPRGELDIGLMGIGLGVQIPFGILNDSAQSWSSAGGSFLFRLLFAVVRDPILFDIGIETAVGHMSSPSNLSWEHNDLEFIVDDEAFEKGRLFQAGLYLGLGIPLVVRDRPYLYLTGSFATGVSVTPVSYYLNASLGLSYFATDRVELRFEILGVHLRRVTGESVYGRGDNTNTTAVSLWMAHLMPAFALHIRF